MEITKQCYLCNKIFYKSKRTGQKNWDKRKFCSHKCSDSFRGSYWKGKKYNSKKGGIYRDNPKKYFEKYREKHREHIKLLAKQYHILNRKKILEKVKKFYKLNPNSHKNWRKTVNGKISIKVDSHNRRIKSKTLNPKILKIIYENNIKKYGTLTCYLCFKPIPIKNEHLEHKIPISKGGTNEINNLDIACQSCNLKKHNKTEQEYRRILQNG